jgi:hypothetical protein
VLVQALGENWSLVLSLAAAGAGSNALSGTIPVFVELDTVRSEVGMGATLSAGGSVGVISNLVNHTYVIAGGLAAAATTRLARRSPR